MSVAQDISKKFASTHFLTPLEFREQANLVFELERPEFRNFEKLTKKPSRRMNMAYASLVVGFAETLDSEERRLVDKLINQIVVGQFLLDEQEVDSYVSYFVLKETDYDLHVSRVAKLCESAIRAKSLTLPVMSLNHNVIVQVESVNDDLFRLKFYNAGLLAEENVTQTIYTHEARPKHQPAVYGCEVYETSLSGLCMALQRILTYNLTCLTFHSLGLTEHAKDAFIKLYNLARTDLGKPIAREMTHVQSVPNCSTRTFREYLRFNLPAGTYKKIYTAISGGDNSIDQKELVAKSPNLYLETFLSVHVMRAFPQAKDYDERPVHRVVSHDLGYYVSFSDSSLKALGGLFSASAHPGNPSVVFLPTQDFQELYQDIIGGIEAKEAIINLANKLPRSHEIEVRHERPREVAI